MDKSDVEFLDNGNVKILGKEFTESFFEVISKPIPEGKAIIMDEDENGIKYFHEVLSKDNG